MNPDISVTIPVYNRFEALKHVVESVLSQTLVPREMILVNDGSNDKGLQGLPSYSASNPTCVKK